MTAPSRWSIAGGVKHAQRQDDSATCEASNWQSGRRGYTCHKSTRWICGRCGERVCGSHISQHQGEQRIECQRWHKVPALSWMDLLGRCSRLHFTGLTGGEHLNIIANLPDDRLPYGEVRTGVIVPTRLHEPGFYLRWDLRYGEKDHDFLRTDLGLQLLHQFVDEGRVRAL